MFFKTLESPSIFRLKAFVDVNLERDRQDVLHGENPQISDHKWNTILGEEVGEAAHAVLERDFENLREELVQVAAVAVRWIEALDAREGIDRHQVLD